MGCWFSSIRLWTSIECEYCVAIMLDLDYFMQ